MKQMREQKPNMRSRMQKNKIHFIALGLITLASFGNNYAFNNPQALHEPLKQTLDISESQFQLFYSVFAFPNILSALFIGYLIDFFEIYKGFVILVFSVAFFQTIVAIGAYYQSYTVILIGRLFFGISSESLITAQAALVSSLFKSKHIALALGIVITFPEIGNALNSLLTYRFYELFDNQLGGPFFMSVVLCLVCTLFAMLAIKFIKIINKAHQQQQANSQSELMKELFAQNKKVEIDAHKQRIRLRDIKQLTYPFWLLTLICTIFLGLYIPFLDGANGLLMTRFLFSEQTAGQMIMITYFSAAFFSIPIGMLIDRIGQRRYICILCAALLLAVQLILYFADANSSLYIIVLAFAFLGMGLAIYANCALSIVSMIVKKKILGTAFGIIQMLQSVSLCVFPIISGALIDQKDQTQEGFLDSEIFFIIVGISGLVFSFGLLFIKNSLKIKLDAGRINPYKRSSRDSFSQSFDSSSSDVSTIHSMDNSGQFSITKSLLSTQFTSKQPRQIQIQEMLKTYLPPQQLKDSI